MTPAASGMLRAAGRIAGRAAFYLLVAALAGYALFPFVWAVITSLKSGGALFSPGLLPDEVTLENYLALFRAQPFARNILNSVLVAGGATAVSLVLALAGAYALARIRFRGRAAVALLILSVSMFPQISVLAGLFELVRWAGLYNSLTALVLSYLLLTLPFTTWVLAAFMRELPIELEEAAAIDGASTIQMLVRVFVPVMAPALAATGLLAFIVAWNEFLFALTFTLTTEQRTVPVAIALISGASAYELPWGRVMAASVIVTAPLIVLVLALQRRIVSGLAAGAVKA